jgi:hypothetical protein
MDDNGVDCDDIPGRTTDCDVEVTYMYLLENVGAVSMDITELERTRDDSTVDLINEVDPKFLLVGESTKVTETEVVDFCDENTFETTVVAKADPPAGVPCEGTGMYEFTVVPPCDVSVELACSLTDSPDTSCDVLEDVTELQCTGCPPTTLCFMYTAADCPDTDSLPPGMKSCVDMNDGPQTMADIVISNGMQMFVDGTFSTGEEFCINDDGAALPAELFIFVNAPMGGMTPESSQLSVIDSTCSGQGLTLLESYGSLDLVHYINCNGDNDCFVPVTFEVTACNDGPTGLTITELESTINGNTDDSIADVDSSALRLEEGECYVAEDPIVAKCCAGVDLEASATVIAEGDDGSICEDDTALDFDKPIETPPPTAGPTQATPVPTPATPMPTPATPVPTPATPMPTPATPMPTAATPMPTDSPAPTPAVFPPGDLCFVQVDVDCIPPLNPENGERFEDCDSIVVAPAECLAPVTLMTFRYGGGDCANSNNIQDPLIFRCEDFFGGPPDVDEIGAESLIVVTDIKGLGVDYFSGIVPVGEKFNVTNPGGDDMLIGANVNITIYDGIVARQNIRQTMVVHTSCSQVTFLKDRYGALELIAFENPSQGFISCLIPLSFNFNIENVAEGFNVILESLTSITNFLPPNNFLNYTSEVAGEELPPNTVFPLSSDPIEIDLSVRMRYTVFTTIQGSSPDGFSCRANDLTNFTAGRPDTRPTSAPVDEPI